MAIILTIIIAVIIAALALAPQYLGIIIAFGVVMPLLFWIIQIFFHKD